MSLVSIIVPAYNAEPYIGVTIQSVLDQTYTSWELIIINDGAKDDTDGAVQPYLSDERIHYYQQENGGVSSARNHGIELAKGDYIAFLDADDEWLQENLEKKIKVLEEDASVDWVFSDMYQADEHLNIMEVAPEGRDDTILDNILKWEGEVVPGPCSNIVIRRKITDSGIRYDKSFSTAADQDFCIQMAAKHKGRRIPEPLWKYRYIPSSMSRNIQVMEDDHIAVFKKAAKNNLFKSHQFEDQCFSNLYLILAGSWWVNGGNKWKGLYFICLALWRSPKSIKVLLSKF